MTSTNRFRAAMAVAVLVALSFPNGAAATDFAKATFYPVGTNPVAIASGDFNRDGKLDLAVANKGSSNVSILLGNGDGTFQSAVNVGAGIAAPESIFVGDFNGDGKLDVAVFAAGNVTENLAGAVSVLLGNGDGTFQAPKVTNLTIYTTQIGLADFNGDKKLDIAASEFNTTFTLSILIGNGDGSFQTPSPLTNSISCAAGIPVVGCVVFAAADFDHDGKVDLVVAGSGGLQVLLGKGDGTFRDGVTVAVADGYSVGWISTADVNGDGATDLVVVSTGSTCVEFNTCETLHYSVFLGNGNGSFRAEQIFDTGSSSRDEFGFGHYDSIGNIVVADFDGDGKLDIVDRHSVKTSEFQGGAPPTITLEIRSGRGDGTFATPIVVDDPGTIGIATDLNGDKLADLVTIGPSNDVEVLLNDTPTVSPDFQVSPSSMDLTLSRGGETSETLAFPAQGGFSGTISLTCTVSGPSPMPTCAVSPASVKAGNAATLTVNANNVNTQLVPMRFDIGSRRLATTLPLVALALVLALTIDRQRRMRWAFWLVVLAAPILSAACGGGGSSTRGPQDFTVTVTATSGAIQHATNIAVTVD